MYCGKQMQILQMCTLLSRAKTLITVTNLILSEIIYYVELYSLTREKSQTQKHTKAEPNTVTESLQITQ